MGIATFRPFFLLLGMTQGLHVDGFPQVSVGAIYDILLCYTRCANAVKSGSVEQSPGDRH